MKDSLLKSSKIVLLIPLGLLLVILFLSSGVQYRLGNFFFGGSEQFYNVDLAQLAFTAAAYPVVGTPPEYAHYQLSRTYFIKGEFFHALYEANQELLLYPENKRTYYILGLTYGYMNREEEAIEAFSQFIEAYPESWAARNDKAWLQFRIGDIEEALLTMEPVKNTRNPWVQNTLGTLLLNNGNLEEAEAALLLAEQLASDMSNNAWGTAYPGNDPKVYELGAEAMRESIRQNLLTLESQLSPHE